MTGMISYLWESTITLHFSLKSLVTLRNQIPKTWD